MSRHGPSDPPPGIREHGSKAFGGTQRRCRSLSALALLLITAAGCGERGPDSFRVHGSVTHAGRPVPLGRIVFEPDGTRGNAGPQGFAPIENGRYDTAARFCKGVIGGPMVVRVDGFERIAGAEDATTAGRRLFETFETRVDLPRSATERDFEVPRSGR